LFFNARSFRDYRDAEIWEPELPLYPLPDQFEEAITSEREAPPRENRRTPPLRTSDTRTPH
jgi:hypothetical protein